MFFLLNLMSINNLPVSKNQCFKNCNNKEYNAYKQTNDICANMAKLIIFVSVIYPNCFNSILITI